MCSFFSASTLIFRKKRNSNLRWPWHLQVIGDLAGVFMSDIRKGIRNKNKQIIKTFFL